MKAYRNEYKHNNDDVTKANLCLVALVLTFILATFGAYLFTDGRHHFVIPILRVVCPRCSWVKQHDKEIPKEAERRTSSLVVRETNQDQNDIGDINL